MLRENDWQIESQVGGFMPIPRFNLAVLDDQLGFKGFNAGLGVNKKQVPKGRPKTCDTQPSLRDSALSQRVPGVETPGYSREVPPGLTLHSAAQKPICARPPYMP